MKPRIFSGIQPSGNLHIGNYLGAIQQWVKLQQQYESIFCIVDLHAITVPQDPEELRKRTLEIAKVYLASGIDPERSTIFVQSHVPAHTELTWILNTIARNGDLTKMTQFKDKSGIDLDDFSKSEISLEELKQRKEQFNSVGVGLFDYPVLMVADILLYDTEIVPVGEDQKQHVELTRTLAKRFNNKFGEVFKVPQVLIQKEAARIMGLDDPEKKMSKSAASEYNYIALNDDLEKARKKIMKAVTDSGSEIVYSDEKPALKNLINIYALLSGKKTSEIETLYQGKKYSVFKKDLADVVVGFLTDFQSKMREYSDEQVLGILHAGAERARPIAQAKMQAVKEKIGFVK